MWGVQEIEVVREGVAVLINDEWYSATFDFGCVSPRVKVCKWWVQGPTEGEAEERERFWNDLDWFVYTVGNWYRLCVLGDLNEWVGRRLREVITGGFGNDLGGVRGFTLCTSFPFFFALLTHLFLCCCWCALTFWWCVVVCKLY